ncbi:MAG: DUF4157 domain-containing protein [Acidimicrobiales bacterium]
MTTALAVRRVEHGPSPVAAAGPPRPTRQTDPRHLPRPSAVGGMTAAVQRRSVDPATPSTSAAERQADRVAKRMTGGGGECTCADCRAADLARQGMAGRLGVRLHTGPAAAVSARLLNANAYTFGNDIVFGEGEYQPASTSGRELLAHEFTHVAQQALSGGRALRRQSDPRQMSITSDWAHQLGDDDLRSQLSLMRDHLSSLAPTDPTVQSATDNLILLQTELYRRSLGVDVQSGEGQLPRPSGLPMGGAYTMFEVPGLASDVVSAMPEGRLIDALPTPRYREQPPSPWGGVMAGTSAGTLMSSAQALNVSGFAAAGDNAIGLVSFPQYGSPGHTGVLQSRLAWGHTAVYARVDGQIQILRSHAPRSLLQTLVADRAGAVKSGQLGVAGAVYGEGYTPGRGIPMFTHTGAQSIEYPVPRSTALVAAERLPKVGPHSLNYTGVPSAANLCQGQNCVRWAVPVAEQYLGGRIGPMTEGGVPTSITDLGPARAPGGAPNQASQGRVYGWMRQSGQGEPIMGWDSRTGTRVVVTLAEDGRPLVNALPRNATGPPVIGRMPASMKYLRWGGRALFVIGLAAGGAEIALAEPEHRARVATGVAGGTAGGILGGAAGGAAAGLVCGPGAPVCSVVGGLIGGFIGALGGRGLAEAVFDYDRAAYRAGSNHFMSELKAKTQGFITTDASGQQWFVRPDPRYRAVAGTIERWESGESGACQTCHEITMHWGELGQGFFGPEAVPISPASWGPRPNSLTPAELQRITDLLSGAPGADTAMPGVFRGDGR